MQSSISEFMKIALAVVVIAALLFVVGYKMVDDEVTGAGGYKSAVEAKAAPTTAIPSGTR